MPRPAALLVFLLLSGCAGPALQAASTTAPAPAPADAGGFVVEAPAPDASSTGETGALEGTVRGADGNLAGATATIPALRGETTTDASGVFLFEGLAAGTYQVRVAREGFKPLVATATVRAGETTRLAITLAADTTAPVLADFWGGRSEVVVADRDYELEGADKAAGLMTQALSTDSCLTGARSRWGGAPVLDFDDPRQLVWPGTSRIEVRLSWDRAAYTGERMGIVWKQEFEGVYFESPLVASGETITIDVPPEAADAPRMRFSGWLLALCIRNTDLDAHARYLTGPVHATITLFRGHDLPVLQPEPDFFLNGTRYTLLDQSRAFGVQDLDLYPTGPCNGAMARSEAYATDAFTFVPEGTLVAPGTGALEARLEWSYGAATAQRPLTLSYRTAEQPAPPGRDPPPDPEAERQPEPVEEGEGYRLYRIPVAGPETDGADDPATAWRFYWGRDAQPGDLCAEMSLRLVVTVVQAQQGDA